jgi:hypothetical protein
MKERGRLVYNEMGQNLLHHPHLHCVVPGGGVAPNGERWIACRPGFFLPVRVLSRLFRRLFIAQLQLAFDHGELQFFSSLEALSNRVAFAKYLAPPKHVEWVVYAKPPFGGPKQVLEYLGRYTHRVAISNNRLIEFSDGAVTFAWKDYRHESRNKTMRLDAHEFIRRFLLHVLPSGFQRIRHYGLLANRYRQVRLNQCRNLLAAPAPVVVLLRCPAAIHIPGHAAHVVARQESRKMTASAPSSSGVVNCSEGSFSPSNCWWLLHC